LTALSESEPLMEEMLSYRFESGASALSGHSLGNLLLAGLAHTRGSFHEALRAAAELLAVRGQVMPSSIASDLKLAARTASGRVLEGETAIGQAGEPIVDLWLDPADCAVYPEAVRAIEDADVVVIGPGSLYTSILPNFLVPGIPEALARSRALKIFVCNIATQHGETDGLSAGDHLRVFERHSGVSVTHVLVNSRIVSLAPEFQQEPLSADDPFDGFDGVIMRADVIDASLLSRHDSGKLAAAVSSIARQT
ncbi:MAG: uridine diphosphate-N-acetylglucosamine-binding protein YvcK, partial [Chloroflexi bacterium]|nr:uridine diphosphate-N-acetylglucosamine-binding protein YvcK [Chloroflexota bacterium]